MDATARSQQRGRHSDLSHTTVTMATGGRVQFQWENFTPMPTSRSFCTAVEGGDSKLYVIGGCEENGVPIDALEAYDPAAKSWEKLDGMPTKRAGPAAVSVGQKIVVLGGVSVTQAPLDAVEVFDIVERKWTQLNPLMAAALGIAAVARAVGGPQTSVEGFDLERKKWFNLPNLNTPLCSSASLLYQGRLLAVGGMSAGPTNIVAALGIK
uniref:Uncharacterized protein n=1 Tax=Branchiostoma floridae TaxID=7739 RepID=C3ZIV4_BRAFL|eukprot:XP_002591544.1 hypothetical protein BRAFLDRAFT_92773 [Branchiostoma floridae]